MDNCNELMVEEYRRESVESHYICSKEVGLNPTLRVATYGLSMPMRDLALKLFGKVFHIFRDVEELGNVQQLGCFIFRSSPGPAVLVVQTSCLEAVQYLIAQRSIDDLHIVEAAQLESSELRVPFGNVKVWSDQSPSTLGTILETVRGEIVGAGRRATAVKLMQVSDEILIAAERDKNSIEAYLGRVGRLLGCMTVASYIPGHDAMTLQPHLWNGPIAFPTIRPRPFLDHECFTPEMKTFRVDGHWLLDDFDTEPGLTGREILVSTSVTAAEVPHLILYQFEDVEINDTLLETVRVASREICHLLRDEELRRRYDCLKEVNSAQRLLPKRQEVFWSICDSLQNYFLSEGASVLRVLEDEENSFVLEKFYKHHGRSQRTKFTVPYGFAHHCLVHRKAIIVTCINENVTPASGACIEYDADAVELDQGKEIQLKTFIAPGTIENEKSIILFPICSTTSENIVGLLKIGNLERVNAYNIAHLRTLGSFADAVAPIFEAIEITEKFNRDHDLLREKTRIAEHAPALFYYRHTALGIFHQVGNILHSLGLQLLDARITALAGNVNKRQLVEVLDQGIDAVNSGKDLIKTAKQRGGSLKPNARRCKLVRDIVRPAIQQAQKILKGASWVITHSLTSEDYWIEVDIDLAKESVFNVLSNAIRAVKETKDPGRRLVFVAVRRIEDTRRVKVEIVDAGVGIGPETIPKLFTPFFTTHGDEGSGLGLYFAKQLLNEFDGTIELTKSLLGKGATFAITLPILEDRR